MDLAGIIDAHVHVGTPGQFFAPQTDAEALVALMDRLEIAQAVCTDALDVYEGSGQGLSGQRDRFQRSHGRLPYLGVFDPRRAGPCLAALREARGWPGFVGLKIHPSVHGVPAEDPAYEPAWRLAADLDLPILTHSWSVSDYNPTQYLSTPARFEGYVRRFPGVRLVLAHAGGRGTGRHEAVRLVRTYANVWMDLAGDIFCYRLIPTLLESVPPDRILFGSDFPWLDPRANLTRVLLADVAEPVKAAILGDNARRVYRLGETAC